MLLAVACREDVPLPTVVSELMTASSDLPVSRGVGTPASAVYEKDKLI